MKLPLSKTKCFVVIAVVIALVVVVSVVVWQFCFKKGDLRKEVKGVVVTNGYQCSDIGASMFEKGGSVADAAIAALLCEGVALPMCMGLGGGFFLTIYNKTTGKVESLNSREVAPSLATEDMYNATYGSDKGGLSVAVPGEIKGYWVLHQKYGVLPWKDLLEPTIELCNNGIYVTSYLAKSYSWSKDLLYQDPVLRDIFINPDNNETYQEGEYVKRPRLAKTLQIIAEEGADALYSANGSLIQTFVKDIQSNNGIITENDLINYEPKWQESVRNELSDDYTLYSSPLPGSGVVLTYMLNILDGFINLNQLYTVQTFQRIIESFKFAYGSRTHLGDVNLDELVSNLTSKEYAKDIRSNIFDNKTSQDPQYYGANSAGVDDHGTAHISVLAPNGDAISVTSTINLVFGAGFASNSTGIILNDEMDDFSKPDSKPSSGNNLISPGKRPQSSIVPTIILKNNDVAMIVGGAGGQKITTTVASVIIKHLWYDIDIQEALNDLRVHHQLFPMTLQLENGFNESWPELTSGLEDIGHQVTYFQTEDGFSALTSISTKNGEIKGAYDTRRGGYITYIYD